MLSTADHTNTFVNNYQISSTDLFLDISLVHTLPHGCYTNVLNSKSWQETDNILEKSLKRILVKGLRESIRVL